MSATTIIVNDETPRRQYTASAGQTVFDFPFPFFENGDLEVYKTPAGQTADDTNDILAITTDYTVSGADTQNGGKITLTSGAANGDIITILRVVDIDRTADYQAAGDLLAETLNREQDTEIMISQQLREESERSIRLQKSDVNVDMTLPAQADRRDTVLTFDTDGKPQATNTASFVAGLSGSILGANYVTNNATGDGSTVNFTLSTAPGAKGNLQIYIDGVYQNKASFSLSGTTVTFTEAPPLNASIEFIIGYSIGSTSGDATGIDFTQSGTGAVTRTVASKLQDVVSVKDFGAVGDGVTNDTAALISALNTGKEVWIPKGSVFTLNAAQTITFIENLNLVSPEEVTVFNLAEGDHAITEAVEVTNPYARNIIIKGSVKTQVNCTAAANVGGSAKNYQIKYTLSDASDVAINDYIYVGYTTGTGNHNVAEGVWKVTAVSGNDVTVKHTLNDTWPSITVTSARVVPLKTILRWPKTDRGLAISGCQLRAVENLVLASQFNVTTESPVDSYSDGLQVGTAADQLNTGSTESQQTNGGAVWMKNVGIVEWQGNGVQTIGGNAYFFQAAACSNGWRGFQASRNGSVSAKYCAAVGNGASGFEAEAMGFVNANGGVAAGNNEQGVYVIGPASVSFINGYSMHNVLSGIDARNFGTVLADGAKVDSNQSRGLYSTSGNILFGASATSANNTTNDVDVAEGGIVNANGASSIGTVNVNYDGGSKVIGADGEVIWPNETILENSTSQAKLVVTSIGDVIFSQDNAGAGYNSTFNIKSTGTIFDAGDGTADCGRASNRWSTVYATTGTINTSDLREKQDIADLEDAEKAVATAIKSKIKKFRFKDAVQAKGDDARIHIGVIAQEVEMAFTENGLNPNDYGIFCYDEWTDEETGERHSRYGVRYEELLAFVIGAM
jgi:hypothetical protein